MISNCEGCRVELLYVEMYSKLDLYFAGEGLYEKGHLFMRMVNDKGEIIIE